MSEDLNEWVRRREAREAREKPLRVKDYRGSRQWLVVHELHGAVQVFAPERISAVWTAAKFWGADPRRERFHQNVRASIIKKG